MLPLIKNYILFFFKYQPTRNFFLKKKAKKSRPNIKKESTSAKLATCANSSWRFFTLSSRFFLLDSWPRIFLIASA